jgi:threonine dehydrogenase-like Zn-dependent dehydrogenase
MSDKIEPVPTGVDAGRPVIVERHIVVERKEEVLPEQEKPSMQEEVTYPEQEKSSVLSGAKDMLRHGVEKAKGIFSSKQSDDADLAEKAQSLSLSCPSAEKPAGETMYALVWHGKRDVKFDLVVKPKIKDLHDVVVKITATTICGSDLHLYNSELPGMKNGDIIGHECMGIIHKKGKGVKDLKVGQRVVVSFNISCGTCFFCKREEFTACENTNPSPDMDKLYGNRCSGLFGYSHITGGYSGCQAQYVRVPFAEINCLPLPDEIPDEKALYLSDIVPTAYHAVAELGCIRQGDIVGVWGLGPVGLLCARWAQILGAKRVIGISGTPERLLLAREKLAIETIDYHKDDVVKTLKTLIPRGLDVAVDATGFRYAKGMLHRAERALMLETDTPEILTECAHALRPFGHLAVIADYSNTANHFPIGHIAMKHLTLSSGQSPTQKNWKKCLEYIQKGAMDPTFVITHRGTLASGPLLYQQFNEKQEGVIKVFLRPESAVERIEDVEGLAGRV